MPGGPIGVNTGSPDAPAIRYATIATAASIGPSSNPASTTTNGCSVSGTGVFGSGMANCDASAIAATAMRMPSARLRELRRARTSVVMSRLPGDGERHRISATEAERREAAVEIAILQSEQQGGEH